MGRLNPQSMRGVASVPLPSEETMTSTSDQTPEHVSATPPANPHPAIPHPTVTTPTDPTQGIEPAQAASPDPSSSEEPTAEFPPSAESPSTAPSSPAPSVAAAVPTEGVSPLAAVAPSTSSSTSADSSESFSGSSSGSSSEATDSPAPSSASTTATQAWSALSVPPSLRRPLLLLALCATTLLVVVATVLVVVRPGLGSDEPATLVIPPAMGPVPPVLTEANEGTPATPAGVEAAITPLLGDERLGDTVAVTVIDALTGQTLFEQNSDTAVIPASVTKILTAAAVLSARGPAYRLTTRAVAGSTPGEVVLVGGGDPTLTVGDDGTYPGAARLDDLAAQVTEALGNVTPTRVVVDASLFTGPTTAGWEDAVAEGYGGHITSLMVDGGRVRPDRLTRSSEPALDAGERFAELLGLPESAVTIGTARADAEELGAVQSPPVIRLVEIMLTLSDNVIAEALARQVALARGLEASFAGAAQATLDVLDELGLPTHAVQLVDGSGLSRENLLTPSLIADLLLLAASDEHPELRGVLTGLPVAAHSGTLAERYTDETAAGAGIVRAKTGNLTGVSSLAGMVTTADGRLLLFAIMANGVPSQQGGREALDIIAIALAQCGCS